MVLSLVKGRKKQPIGDYTVDRETFLTSLPREDRIAVESFEINLRSFLHCPVNYNEELKSALLPLPTTLSAVGVPVSGYGFDPNKGEFTTESDRIYLKIHANHPLHVIRLHWLLNDFEEYDHSKLGIGYHRQRPRELYVPSNGARPIELIRDYHESFPEFMRRIQDPRSPRVNKFCILYQE